MHIVHNLQKEHNPANLKPGDPKASQFGGAVLGFLFKVMPDSWFSLNKIANPEILYHDKFLQELVSEQRLKLS